MQDTSVIPQQIIDNKTPIIRGKKVCWIATWDTISKEPLKESDEAEDRQPEEENKLLKDWKIDET